MKNRIHKFLDVHFPLVFGLLFLAGPAIALTISACTSPRTVENHGWRETEPPRPDLQCWVRWSDSKTAICAPSLTSTHGASR